MNAFDSVSAKLDSISAKLREASDGVGRLRLEQSRLLRETVVALWLAFVGAPLLVVIITAITVGHRHVG